MPKRSVSYVGKARMGKGVHAPIVLSKYEIAHPKKVKDNMPTTKITTMIPSEVAMILQDMYPDLSIHLAAKQYMLDTINAKPKVEDEPKAFRVKIVRSTISMWYQPFIGKVFSVVENEDGDKSEFYRLTKLSFREALHLMIDMGDEEALIPTFSGLNVKKYDCEIVEEK